MNILDNFKIGHEKEDLQTISANILNGIEFKGTNLWILIFAIFIASLGLNVNSTAVIIGAMLVSPLMGPIIGMGFGMAINDLSILTKSFASYLFASAVSLATSTLFFLLSPINDAHSEILARTAPNIYDVLIASFGGLAGILALSSRLKGNVIPGVAIATALMPPLCTAGYGLATLQFEFFFGAFYLFLINTVFIALATLVTTRFLKFPFKRIPNKVEELKAKRIVWGVVVITLLPSLYFGYDMVQQNKITKQANLFIESEAVFPNDYLLKKEIDVKKQTITLTYGGLLIEDAEIARLEGKLPAYNLSKFKLEIRQGFSYLKDDKGDEQTLKLTMELTKKDKQISRLKNTIDSLSDQPKFSRQIHNELKVHYPGISSLVLEKGVITNENEQRSAWIAVVQYKGKWDKKDQSRIEDWLKIRLKIKTMEIYFIELKS